ncbi:MAG: glycosyltransferase family 4 protein [Lachnospiraceae bacterium]
MMREALVLANVGGFLEKFEKDNIMILKKLGYTVHYAANMEEQKYEFNEEEVSKLGIKLHHVDIERSPYVLSNYTKAFSQLVKILRQNDIKLIHCHTPVGGVFGRLASRWCWKQHIKVIYTAHGFHFYQGAPLRNNTLYYFVEKILALSTDVLIVINDEDYKKAKSLRLKKGGKVYKIPGVGLDLQKFKPLSQAERLAKRKELGIREDEFFLVSVGELNLNKNHQVVLRALAKMKRNQHRFIHIKYAICGSGFLADRMPRWIRRLHLEDTVNLYGYRKDVGELAGCADAMIFPSKREGLGMAALESLAMAVPVIASDNRGTREYMKHKKNGYLCSYDDVEGFISGIEFVHDLDEQQREKMKTYCRESVSAFDKKYVNEIMEHIYRELEEQ